MPWKLFQLGVWLGFVAASIHFEWEATGIAVGVGGGILAWYATGIVNGLWLAFRRLLGLSVPPRPIENVGQLDAWAAEVGLRGMPARGGSLTHDRQQ